MIRLRPSAPRLSSLEQLECWDSTLVYARHFTYISSHIIPSYSFKITLTSHFTMNNLCSWDSVVQLPKVTSNYQDQTNLLVVSTVVFQITDRRECIRHRIVPAITPSFQYGIVFLELFKLTSGSDHQRLLCLLSASYCSLLWPIFPTLKMEATFSSETPLDLEWTTQSYYELLWVTVTNGPARRTYTRTLLQTDVSKYKGVYRISIFPLYIYIHIYIRERWKIKLCLCLTN